MIKYRLIACLIASAGLCFAVSDNDIKRSELLSKIIVTIDETIAHTEQRDQTIDLDKKAILLEESCKKDKDIGKLIAQWMAIEE